MSVRQRLENRLRDAGIILDSLSAIPGVEPTVVLTVGYTTSGEIAVTRISPCDTAVYFDGLHCPFPGVTLLVERAVAEDCGLIPAAERPDEHEKA
jgi:hypothetical protein